MARCVSASVAVGSESAVRGVSHLACQRQLEAEENCWGMVILLRESETLSWNSSSGCCPRAKLLRRDQVCW